MEIDRTMHVCGCRDILIEKCVCIPEICSVFSWVVIHSLGRYAALAARVLDIEKSTGIGPVPLMVTTVDER